MEEYPNSQKTGSRIEDMQFTTIARLEPAIALLSVVATTLLNLRDASRRPDAKTRRATTILAKDYVECSAFGVIGSFARIGQSIISPMLWRSLGGHQNREEQPPT